MDTLMSTYNDDDEDDVATPLPPVNDLKLHPLPDDGEDAESPPKKKQKPTPTATLTLIHDVQPPLHQVQPPRPEEQSHQTLIHEHHQLQSPHTEEESTLHTTNFESRDKSEQTLIHDVQPPQHQVQSPHPEEELTREKSEKTLIHDVQSQQHQVQSPEELALQNEDCGEKLGRDQQDDEEDGGERTLIHDVQPQQHQVQSPEELTLQAEDGGEKLGDDEEDGGERKLIHDVQPQQLEVQSEEGKSISEELPSSEQDLSQQADELTLTTPEEMVTPSTAKSASKSSKKSKKKNVNNVWTRPTSRKGKKKAKSNQNNGNHTTPAAAEERVFISPVPKFPDKNDDNSELSICLSKFYKAEKVEISEDRLSAGSTKGYRMVRATRGVVEGAWYFEIKVMHLGETGHTRLGWSTEKGDLQAPVGFDANSFGYRDIDGSKVHKALRETYGEEGYGEGDVLGFYINLPDGSSFEPKPPRYVWFKGQRYVCAPDAKEDPPKVVPGSEICFFKNGICQGTAFTDLFGGRYYPAASMYTLPNQSNCLVRFNFGPDFDSFPGDFGGRPVPRPMIEVAYHGCDGRVENGNGSLWNSTRTSSMLKVTKEQGTLFVEASEIDMD